jgi:anti-sigma B factor antagonist
MAGLQLFETRRDDGLVVVCVAGQLDIDTAPVLRSAFEALLAESQPRIIADLSRVTFCDSIGLGTFAYAHSHCTARGGFIRLAAPTPFLARILDTVGLSGTVGVFGSVEAAAAALGGAAGPAAS